MTDSGTTTTTAAGERLLVLLRWCWLAVKVGRQRLLIRLEISCKMRGTIAFILLLVLGLLLILMETELLLLLLLVKRLMVVGYGCGEMGFTRNRNLKLKILKKIYFFYNFFFLER
jgi:hypothetical protein